MKALIYCRVSSQRQVNEGNGLDSQEQRCRVYAKSNNHEVVKVFPDEGVSGRLFDRPAMQSLISYLDEHPLERFVIIFDDLSRLARDLGTHLRLTTELSKVRGAILESPNFKFEDTPEGEFIEHVLASKAELDREQNRRQVMQKQQARLERGYWPFMLPKGLVNKKDPIHGKIAVAREPYASMYKVAIEKFAEGLLITPDEVRLFLHEEYRKKGILDKPALSTVQKILSEPLYAGYMEYSKRNISFKKAQHEGFISVETYYKVQQRLKERSKPWKRKDYAADFPLRPHVYCANCDIPLTASWHKKGKYPHYFCRYPKCIYRWKVTSKYKLEQAFETLLIQSKPLDEYIDLTQKVLEEQWEIRLEQSTLLREKIIIELKETNDGVASYIERIGKTKDDELIGIYEDKVKELRSKKKELEQELAKQEYTSEEFGTASGKVFKTLKDPVSMWESSNYNDKKSVLLMYFEEKLRYDYINGFGTASLAYPVKLINEVATSKNRDVEMSSSELECKE